MSLAPTNRIALIHGSAIQIINIVLVTMFRALFLTIFILVADGGLTAPTWDSEGPVSFRRYYTELMAWLAVTGPKNPPQAQAGAIQLAMRGTQVGVKHTASFHSIWRYHKRTPNGSSHLHPLRLR